MLKLRDLRATAAMMSHAIAHRQWLDVHDRLFKEFPEAVEFIVTRQELDARLARPGR